MVITSTPVYSSFCNVPISFLIFHCSDSADKVVQGQGKFEEIVVASNEITASTVQLVSATKKLVLTVVHNQGQ